MDSRNLFQFRFVDRLYPQKVLLDFVNGKLQTNTLWISSFQGIGKTRLIQEIISKDNVDNREYIFCSFEDNKEIDKVVEFIKLLQDKAKLSFTDFLKTNYISLLDISKQITVQILKLVGVDFSGFVDSIYDGTKLFINHQKQQHSAIKVVANYINEIINKNTLVIVFDHFSLCKKESVDFFMQIIGQFIDNPNIYFVISTTNEEMEVRNDIRDKLLLKIPVIPLKLEPFDEDIYFYEILQEIFGITKEARSLVSQVFTVCEGSPVRLQAALMELYRDGSIQIKNDTASIDLNSLKISILKKDIDFKLDCYKANAQTLLRLVIGFKEQAPLSLLLEAATNILKNLFQGMIIPTENLSDEIGNLYQHNIIDIVLEDRSVVKIGNPIIRESLQEKFSRDPVHRLFSQKLVSYLCENKEKILSFNVSQEWLDYILVIHSIEGQISNWIQYAVKYGIIQYERNYISIALEIFNAIKEESDSIVSEDLIKIADCFFKEGDYNTAESMLQVIDERGDYNKWLFYYSYCRIQNLQLKKESALELAQKAVEHSNNNEEHIMALNMQQQILVDMANGKERAKNIFDDIAEQFKESDNETQKIILPTLKSAIDFYHGEEALAYLNQAKKKALKDNNQLEEAFILNNEGFEYFRQGKVEMAKCCFNKSINKLTNLRIHEISYPLNNLANCYMSRDCFAEAITILLRASLWNTSGYASISIKTLLMVCYAHIGEHKKSLKIADDLISCVDLFGITDTTMLRKIYLNIALVYKHLNEEQNLITMYALKAYPLSVQTSSWYRAFRIAHQNLTENNDNPMSFCRRGEEWYWTNGHYEPWLITFSHD